VPSSSPFSRSQQPPKVGRRWLVGLAFLLILLMASVLVLAAVGSTVQSGVRAYVGGEGLWSKAQKDATLHLARYMETGSEANWAGYLREIDVILGDSRARLELERPDADMAVVAEGLIAGRNAPEDVAAMALVFRTFRAISYIDRAITVWRAADAEIDELRRIADRIRTAVLAGDVAARSSLSAELEAANVRLTGLEVEFSQTLGEGARWVQEVLHFLKVIIVALLVIISATLGRFMVGRIRATDRAAADALRANEARLRLLFEHLPAIVWTTDEHLLLTSLTGDGLTRLGIDEGSLVGRPLDDLFEDDVEADAYLAAHRSALDGTGGGSYRAMVGGRTFQVHVEPLTVDRRVVGAIGVGLDLTDQLELGERPERATRMERISRLAGGVAHDFNNLLTAITGYSDLLVSGLPDGEQRHDAEEIRRAAKRATDLTGQLLAVGRRSVLKPEFISPNVVINEMRNMLHRVIGDEIAIQFELDPAIPFVLADPGQLEQVILNLAVNARDAMPDGGRLTIATRVLRTDRDRPGAPPSRIAIVVSDTGIGMDEATRARIFEPFFTTKAQGKGTGLGLSTAYGIVSQSGGSIRVVSEPGAGATFTITLAAASAGQRVTAEHLSESIIPATLRRLPVDPTSDWATGSARAELVPADVPGAPTILVAEDEAAVRALVEHVLRTAGFKVVAAVDGREALDLAGGLPKIDLLLTDVMMPRLNGPELAAALREWRPDQRVLFMSGFTNDSLGERGVISPDVELLPKPFAPNELLDRVRRVLAVPVGREAGRGEVA
jgi:signal transduction histidine kinase/CheY-like chemotaxis protein